MVRPTDEASDSPRLFTSLILTASLRSEWGSDQRNGGVRLSRIAAVGSQAERHALMRYKFAGLLAVVMATVGIAAAPAGASNTECQGYYNSPGATGNGNAGDVGNAQSGYHASAGYSGLVPSNGKSAWDNC
jgi:hypothetical protein